MSTNICSMRFLHKNICSKSYKCLAKYFQIHSLFIICLIFVRFVNNLFIERSQNVHKI